MKKIITLFLVLIILLCPSSLAEADSEVTLSDVTVKCSMSSFGLEAEEIILHVNDASPLLSLSADDFILTGCIPDGNTKQKNTVAVNDVCFTADSVILSVAPFMAQKSTAMELDCVNDALDCNYGDVTAIICPERDAFTDEAITVGKTTLRYKLYTPPSFKTDEKVPVVIYNHGGGCTGYEGVLTDDSFACAWALAENQQSIKCYVMAPYRASLKEGADGDEEMQAIKAAIDTLVTDGHADSNRIYMTGESMGSLYTWTFANTYPNYLAAIAVMNGGPMDIEKDATLEETVNRDLESPWSDGELKALANSQTSVMLIQGLGDIASVPIRYATVYAKLVNLGMTPDVDVVWNAYTADQFNALLKGVTKIPIYANSDIAIDPITGIESPTNGNFHNSSRAAGWDTRVRLWLIQQRLNPDFALPDC